MSDASGKEVFELSIRMTIGTLANLKNIDDIIVFSQNSDRAYATDVIILYKQGGKYTALGHISITEGEMYKPDLQELGVIAAKAKLLQENIPQTQGPQTEGHIPDVQQVARRATRLSSTYNVKVRGNY